MFLRSSWLHHSEVCLVSGLIRLMSHHFAREMASSFVFLATSGRYPSLRGHIVALFVISRLLSLDVGFLLFVVPVIGFLRCVSCLPRCMCKCYTLARVCTPPEREATSILEG